MAQYVISYRQTENGVQYYATPGESPGENHLVGFAFGSPQDAEVIAMSLNQQQATPESAYNLVPGLAQDRKAPILTPQESTPDAPVSGTPPMSDADAIAKGEQDVREARSRSIMESPPALTPSSGLADQHAYNRYSMDNRDPTPFGNTPTGQAEKDFLGQKAFGGTGSAPGVLPTDWGLFEQDLLAGNVDPRRAVNQHLQQQGMPTHANRGFLEDTYENYGTLRRMQSPGLTPEPVEQFQETSGFMGDLFGMTGDSMNRVDTQGLWDNQFSDDYQTALGGEYTTATAGGVEGMGEQHQYEFNDINNNIAALAPHIGEQNAGYLMTLTQQAYDEYIGSPVRNQMTFAQYLRDVKGAGEWY